MKNEIVIQGSIKFLNLGELIQILCGNGSSGVLRIKSPYATEFGIVYFDKGNIINASSGVLSGLDALYSLFGWIEGKYEFTETVPVCERVINQSHMTILLDGMRMLDDGEVEILGPDAVGAAKNTFADNDANPPVIQGPPIDYTYIVSEEEFHDGESIFEEGRHGDWIWVVLEGVVDVARDHPSGFLTVYRLGNGSFVGDVASFLIRNSTRTYSAKAVGKVQLGVIDCRRLAQECSKASDEFKALVLSIDRRLRHITNRLVEYANKENDLDTYLKFRKVVAKQGRQDNRLFLVQHGKASLIQKTDDGIVPLMILEPDDVFGHMPFLDTGHEPEFASVLASEDIEIQTLDSDVIQSDYDTISTTFRNIIENIATRIKTSTTVLKNMQKELKN